MGLPPYEPQQVPEGHYKFKVMAEPERRKKTSSGGREFVTILFSFKLVDEFENVRYHKESFIPWDDRYRDLLLAFGAKADKNGKVHLGEKESVLGKVFEAEIIHQVDKQDTTKIWSRISNIKVEDEDDVPKPNEPPEDEEDTVPF
ncbi:MAG: hypothetical protein V3V81_07960 [Candidatus Bathyarchaeia archaeon]